MSTDYLKTFRQAADCSTLTLWEETTEAPRPKTKGAVPPGTAPVAVADVTRKIRSGGKGGEDRTESFLFTVRPSLRLSLQSGDILESLVGAGVLENTKRASGSIVVAERAPVTVPTTAEAGWVFRKLDGGPTLLRVVGKIVGSGTGPRLKCMQPPLRCDP